MPLPQFSPQQRTLRVGPADNDMIITCFSHPSLPTRKQAERTLHRAQMRAGRGTAPWNVSVHMHTTRNLVQD